MNERIAQQVTNYANRLQSKVDEHFGSTTATRTSRPSIVVVDHGKEFAKISLVNDVGQITVHSFVSMDNGRIYRADGNARGIPTQASVFDEDRGMSAARVYGVN